MTPHIFQRSRNASTRSKWYEWGRPRAWRALRQSLTPSITLSLFFFCFSSSFPPVSARPYAFLQARLVKEVFGIPPEDISPRRFSFTSRGPRRAKLSNSYSIFSPQACLFLSRVMGSNPWPCPIINRSPKQSSDWSSYWAYWTINIKKCLANKFNVGT